MGFQANSSFPLVALLLTGINIRRNLCQVIKSLPFGKTVIVCLFQKVLGKQNDTLLVCVFQKYSKVSLIVNQ
ncbi:MAG: hypothetical protein ACK56F_15400, partial [bacterium]